MTHKVSTAGRRLNSNGSRTRFYEYRGYSFSVRELGSGRRSQSFNYFKPNGQYVYRVGSGTFTQANSFPEARKNAAQAIDQMIKVKTKQAKAKPSSDVYIVLMTKFPGQGPLSKVVLVTRNYAKAFYLMKSLRSKLNTTAEVVTSTIR